MSAKKCRHEFPMRYLLQPEAEPVEVCPCGAVRAGEIIWSRRRKPKATKEGR